MFGGVRRSCGTEMWMREEEWEEKGLGRGCGAGRWMGVDGSDGLSCESALQRTTERDGFAKDNVERRWSNGCAKGGRRGKK